MTVQNSSEPHTLPRMLTAADVVAVPTRAHRSTRTDGRRCVSSRPCADSHNSHPKQPPASLPVTMSTTGAPNVAAWTKKHMFTCSTRLLVSVRGGERGKTWRTPTPMRWRVHKAKKQLPNVFKRSKIPALSKIRTRDRWFRRPVRFHCAMRATTLFGHNCTFIY